MPEIVLISVLLPAPLSPTIAVTWPAGMSRVMSLRARTGPKFLPMPARRSSGWDPSDPSASRPPAWSRTAGAWTGWVSCASCACGAWSESGADARPAVAGRASSALGLVTGRASLRSASWCSLRYPGGLAGGRVGPDAQLGDLRRAVRDDGRVHVGRGDPLRLEQHRRHVDAGLAVLRRAVHQGGRRGLAGPQEHGQRHGGLRLYVDRLVDRAALVAGQDVLQPDEGRVLAGGWEGPGLDALRLQVVDDGGGVLVVRGDDRVDVLVRGELLLEFAQRHAWRPRPGRNADQGVTLVGEKRVEHSEVALGEQ